MANEKSENEAPTGEAAAKPLKKLRLSKETIRSLHESEIQVGQDTFFCAPSGPQTCNTWTNCPTHFGCCSCYWATGQ